VLNPSGSRESALASALPVLSEDYANNSWARINLCDTWTPCGHWTAQVSQSPHRTAWCSAAIRRKFSRPKPNWP
jgi:hypothetical protein